MLMNNPVSRFLGCEDGPVYAIYPATWTEGVLPNPSEVSQIIAMKTTEWEQPSTRVDVPWYHPASARAAYPLFRPHPLLRNPHAQTLFAAYLAPKRHSYRAQQHIVGLDDGDQIVLHDDRPQEWREGDRVALLMHGLCGSHDSPYMPRLAIKLNQRGIRTFRMDLRGYGAGFHLARLPGHAGRSEDARAAVQEISALCPHSPITAVGFSMSGNILLKLAGEVGDDPPGGLDSCLAVCPPIDILACSLNMAHGLNRLYGKKFTSELVRKLKLRQPETAEISLRPTPRTIWDFDDRVTAPLSGFENARDYYARASSRPLFPQIQLRTLIITAADDPLIPVTIFHDAETSPTTSVWITEHGGHVGYVGIDGVDADRYWLDWRIVEWVTGSEPATRLTTQVRTQLTTQPTANFGHAMARTE